LRFVHGSGTKALSSFDGGRFGARGSRSSILRVSRGVF
jgi:hypothetical protein